jgi:hypothetical protein
MAWRYSGKRRGRCVSARIDPKRRPVREQEVIQNERVNHRNTASTIDIKHREARIKRR